MNYNAFTWAINVANFDEFRRLTKRSFFCSCHVANQLMSISNIDDIIDCHNYWFCRHFQNLLRFVKEIKDVFNKYKVTRIYDCLTKRRKFKKEYLKSYRWAKFLLNREKKEHALFSSIVWFCIHELIVFFSYFFCSSFLLRSRSISVTFDNRLIFMMIKFKKRFREINKLSLNTLIKINIEMSEFSMRNCWNSIFSSFDQKT